MGGLATFRVLRGLLDVLGLRFVGLAVVDARGNRETYPGDCGVHEVRC